MANRPVFMVREARPHYSVWNCEFDYNPGFSPTQKRKNIAAIHDSFKKYFPEKRILEISSKSTEELGVALSAFNLKKYVPSLGRSVPVECVYQAGKVFSGGVSFPDLLTVTPKAAKRDERLSASGRICAFRFEGVDYPTEPKNAFYDFLYISALLENEELLNELCRYDAFTDIEFNPERSINCQARAAAILVSLYRSGELDKARDFDTLASLFSHKAPGAERAKAEEKKEEQKPTYQFSSGQRISHPVFGEGEIIEVSGTTLRISFSVGEKILGDAWVREKCKLI